MDQHVAQKIERHFAQYPLRSYGKGQILIHAGDEPQHIFYLVSGKVSQYDISYRGDEVVVNAYKPGSFFPMLWAITKRPNQYFFSAATATTVRLAPCDEVLAFLHDNPDVVYDLLSRLYIGVDGLLGRMAHLMAGSAKSRLMYELVVACRRFGKQADDGSYRITITEAELAAHAGLSRETVSRELQKLLHDGQIAVSRQEITVKHINTLEKNAST